MNRPPGILDRPLSPAVRERLGGRETQAVLVGRADHADVLAAVTRSLDASAVEHIQTEVMAGRIVPEYCSSRLPSFVRTASAWSCVWTSGTIAQPRSARVSRQPVA